MVEEDKASRDSHVLPVVEKMRTDIDRIFVRYVGPIAPEISNETYAEWTKTGNTGPTGLLRYIHQLSRNILEDDQRAPFFEEARHCIRLNLRS